MSTETSDAVPSWLNLFNIINGFIISALAVVLIGQFGLNYSNLFSIVATAFIIIGVIRLINGYVDVAIMDPIRKANMIIGGYLILTSVLILFIRTENTNLSFFIASSGLFSIGIIRILIGKTDPRFSSNYSLVVMVIGAVTSLIAALALILVIGSDPYAFSVLGIAFLLSGLTRAVSGLMRMQSDN